MFLFQLTQKACLLCWCIVLIPSARCSLSSSHRGNYNYRNSRRQRPQITAPPCKLFIWDTPSAFRYHLCKRLLRGNIYEGLGGKRFVRIKPKSVLESLYPPSMHGPDRCLLCHHSFDNHLSAWWFKHRYTPFDTLLDDTTMKYSEEIETTVDIGNKKKKSKRRKNGIGEGGRHVDLERQLREHGRNGNQINSSSRPMPKRVYHKQYVTDISYQTKNDKKNKRRTRAKVNSNSKTSRLPTNDSHIVLDDMHEKRRVCGVLYQVPKFQFKVDEEDEGIGFGKAAALLLTRVLILERFNGSLYLQEKENEWNKWKWSQRLFV